MPFKYYVTMYSAIRKISCGVRLDNNCILSSFFYYQKYLIALWSLCSMTFLYKWIMLLLHKIYVLQERDMNGYNTNNVLISLKWIHFSYYVKILYLILVCCNQREIHVTLYEIHNLRHVKTISQVHIIVGVFKILPYTLYTWHRYNYRYSILTINFLISMHLKRLIYF